MQNTMTDYDLRVLIFLLCFTSFLSWQSIKPKVIPLKLAPRWGHNFSLFFIDTLLVRIAQPVILSFIAITANDGAFLHISALDAFPFISLVLAILLLDLAIYWQHRVSHILPFLWRIHQVHHTDPQIDISTAVRFHPIEIFLSLLYKAVVIYVFSIPYEAVLIFDILLNASAMFNHSNGRLPRVMDTYLRLFLVTPDMHRIHHSQNPKEANSNYGFFLSLWDRLFNSYTHDAKEGEKNLKTGHPQYANFFEKKPEKLTLLFLIKMPFSFKNNKIEAKEHNL